MRITWLSLALCAVALSGCAQNYTLVARSVALPSALNQTVPPRSNLGTILVLSPDFKGYTHTKEVYNWAWGAIAPDTANLMLGPALGSGVKGVLLRHFSSVLETDNMKTATQLAKAQNAAIFVPEITGSGFLVPIARLAAIPATVSMRYTIYDSTGSVLAIRTLDGAGEGRMGMTRKSYQVAMERAIEALLRNLDFELTKVAHELPL